MNESGHVHERACVWMCVGCGYEVAGCIVTAMSMYMREFINDYPKPNPNPKT
jgi:hypothetical protein